MKPYRLLACYYDELFPPVRSPIDAARARILASILPRVESACDLACGTADTALNLASKGIRTYAVDAAPMMCRVARLKARHALLPVRVVPGDMRSFRLPQQVQLVVCEGDALNHLPRRAELGKVARAVSRALQPGGHFFFDVNNSSGFERYWSGTVCLERPGLVLLMRNGHSAAADRAWSDIDLFIQEGTKWVRHQERVEEVCWDAAEIRDALEQAGFDRVRAWDAAPFFAAVADAPQTGRKNRLVTRGCRTFYLARKAGV